MQTSPEEEVERYLRNGERHSRLATLGAARDPLSPLSSSGLLPVPC